YLYFGYPLTGTFVFSVDAYNGAWAEGGVAYGGRAVDVGGRFLRGDDFNRLTVEVQPGRTRFLVNDRPFSEESDSDPTSPWLALFTRDVRHTAFRNFTLRGRPEISQSVPLLVGDRLDCWSTFFTESRAPRRAKEALARAADPEAGTG